MKTTMYDLFLLITKSNELFSIFGMQTDDTIILADEKWSKLVEMKLVNAGLEAKPKDNLLSKNLLTFNWCILRQLKDNIILHQKEQGEELKLVYIGSPSIS